jgi:hypothetical protein
LLFVLSVTGQAQKKPDALGTVTSSQIACPTTGLVGTACYALKVSCPRIQTYTVYLKAIAPSASPVGVATLTQGGTSVELYESYTYGPVTIQNLQAAQFLVVEITFGNPFNGTQEG